MEASSSSRQARRGGSEHGTWLRAPRPAAGPAAGARAGGRSRSNQPRASEISAFWIKARARRGGGTSHLLALPSSYRRHVGGTVISMTKAILVPTIEGFIAQTHGFLELKISHQAPYLRLPEPSHRQRSIRPPPNHHHPRPPPASIGGRSSRGDRPSPPLAGGACPVLQAVHRRVGQAHAGRVEPSHPHPPRSHVSAPHTLAAPESTQWPTHQSVQVSQKM
jgi:hypothetical protein